MRGAVKAGRKVRQDGIQTPSKPPAELRATASGVIEKTRKSHASKRVNRI